MRLTPLFISTAAAEASAGLALLISPAMVVALLIGTHLEGPGGFLITRVAGTAMVSIAVACWLARGDEGSQASRGLLVALLVYHTAITVLLVHGALASGLQAIGLWPTVALHAGFAAWCVSARGR
jgi:hypothetical protein